MIDIYEIYLFIRHPRRVAARGGFFAHHRLAQTLRVRLSGWELR